MTAFELSEKKVQFTKVSEVSFEKEHNDNDQYVLTSGEYNILLNKIQEGIDIINEYLKEKG